MKEILVALRMTAVTLVLTGMAYPLLVTGLARLLFPHQAEGSLLRVHGLVFGSELLGQAFSRPEYFQPRPSAAGGGYDAAASSGSNLGPTSRKLRDRVAQDAARLRAENPAASGPVPLELVTASASGLDPHLSPEAALWQAPRVATSRRIPATELEALVRERVEPRTFGFLGEPRVNVLLLNLELDRRAAAQTPRLARPLGQRPSLSPDRVADGSRTCRRAGSHPPCRREPSRRPGRPRRGPPAADRRSERLRSRLGHERRRWLPAAAVGVVFMPC